MLLEVGEMSVHLVMLKSTDLETCSELDSILAKQEWESSDPMVFACLKVVSQVLKEQSEVIDSLKRQLEIKVSKQELKSELAQKASIEDLSYKFSQFQDSVQGSMTLIDDKVSRSDLQAHLIDKVSYSELKEMLQDKLDAEDFRAEIDNLYGSVNKLYNTQESSGVNELYGKLREKPSFEQVEEMIEDSKVLKKKAEKSELAKKADACDIQTILGAIESKADLNWVETLQHKIEELTEKKNFRYQEDWGEMSKFSMQEIENHLNRHFEEINNFIESLSSEIYSIKEKQEQSTQRIFSEFKEVCEGLKLEKSKDKENYQLMKSTNHKALQNLNTELLEVKEEMDLLKDYTNKNYEEIRNSQKFTEEVFKDIREINKTVSGFKEFLENKADKQEVFKRFQAIQEDKAEVSQVEEVMKQKNTQILSTLQSLKDELKKRFSAMHEEILNKCDEKISKELYKKEFEALLSNRENELDKVYSQVCLVSSKQEHFENQLKALSKQLTQKPNTADVCKLLDNKPNIEDINESLQEINTELESKLDSEEFLNFAEEHNMVTNTLCSEVCMGRWIWLSGSLKNCYVPWEEQSINMNPSNFIWEEERIYILLEEAGIYEVCLGVFAEGFVYAELVINGEKLLTKQAEKQLSLVKFLCLGKRTRVSLVYDSKEKGSGFISLRKL